MPLRYDGNSIVRHNSISYESYHDYMRRSNEESEKVTQAALRSRVANAKREWLRQCPPPFGKATIESIGEHDENAMMVLKRAVERSKRKGRPQSIFIGSTDGGADHGVPSQTGKTWAIYAYINALFDAGVILDPIGQVTIAREVDILDGYTEWRPDAIQRTRRRLFEGRTLVAVDDINSGAGDMKRAKYGKDAWTRFATDAERYPDTGIVAAFSGDFDDMSLTAVKTALGKVMNGAENVLLVKGVGR